MYLCVMVYMTLVLISTVKVIQLHLVYVLHVQDISTKIKIRIVPARKSVNDPDSCFPSLSFASASRQIFFLL